MRRAGITPPGFLFFRGETVALSQAQLCAFLDILGIPQNTVATQQVGPLQATTWALYTAASNSALNLANEWLASISVGLETQLKEDLDAWIAIKYSTASGDSISTDGGVSNVSYNPDDKRALIERYVRNKCGFYTQVQSMLAQATNVNAYRGRSLSCMAVC